MSYLQPLERSSTLSPPLPPLSLLPSEGYSFALRKIVACAEQPRNRPSSNLLAYYRWAFGSSGPVHIKYVNTPGRPTDVQNSFLLTPQMTSDIHTYIFARTFVHPYKFQKKLICIIVVSQKQKEIAKSVL